MLAEDIPIKRIPSQSYGVTRLEIDIIHSFIPVAIDIKPGGSRFLPRKISYPQLRV